MDDEVSGGVNTQRRHQPGVAIGALCFGVARRAARVVHADTTAVGVEPVGIVAARTLRR